MFSDFQVDYEDGLGIEAGMPELMMDPCSWDASPLEACELPEDSALDHLNSFEAVSDDSDDTLFHNSCSASSLDSDGSGGVLPAMVPTRGPPPPAVAMAALVPQAPRTLRVSDSPQPAPRAWQREGSCGDTELTREERVQRYREKRKRRTFEKTIRYEARRAYAEVRPRIKGRFATKAEVAAMKAEAAAGIPPVCQC